MSKIIMNLAHRKGRCKRDMRCFGGKSAKIAKKWDKKGKKRRKVRRNGGKVKMGKKQAFFGCFWAVLARREQPHGRTRTSTDGHGHLGRRCRGGNRRKGRDRGRRRAILDYSSTWMKVWLFAAGQHDAEKITKNSVFIHVDPRRDDSNPSALFCGVRSMPIELHPARLASGPDLSRASSRLWRRWERRAPARQKKGGKLRKWVKTGRNWQKSGRKGVKMSKNGQKLEETG